MSDLERAQEWLGCRQGEFVDALTGNVEAICEMHGLADDWPCRKATGLAALLAETRAEALTRAADKWQWGDWANAPRGRDIVRERIATAQYVTDWLRARAEEVRNG